MLVLCNMIKETVVTESGDDWWWPLADVYFWLCVNVCVCLECSVGGVTQRLFLNTCHVCPLPVARVVVITVRFYTHSLLITVVSRDNSSFLERLKRRKERDRV